MEAIVRRRFYWAAALITPFALLGALVPDDMLPFYFIQEQDLPVLLLFPILLVLVTVWMPDWRLPYSLPPPVLLWTGSACLILLLGWGTYALMLNYPLCRDEHMVVFDMAVFDTGRLAVPLAPQWRDFAEALVPNFLMNADRPYALVSSYLPMNALLRLLFSKVADPVFFNPVLIVMGGAALFDIARRAFGEDHRAIWVVMLIYLTSTQTLVASMTTYSMTAHMTCNLIWLAAFLRGGRMHAVAIAVGAIAVGLHQIAFHVLFIAPFLLWRASQRSWRVVLLYALAYLAIMGWWISYPHLVVQETGAARHMEKGTADFFTGKVLPLLLDSHPRYTTILTLLNLFRFFDWQNLALGPLLVAAAPLIYRDRGLAAPLLGSIGLSFAVISFVLPYQGYGWGYRYLHPCLGSIALAAGYGYQRLSRRIGDKADAMVLSLSAVTILFAVPLLMVRAHQFVAMHVALEDFVARQKARFILLDTELMTSNDGKWAPNSWDQVRNSPDLSNPMLRFSSRHMSVRQVAELCRRGPVRLVTRTDMHRVGFAVNEPQQSPRFSRMVADVAAMHPRCFSLSSPDGS